MQKFSAVAAQKLEVFCPVGTVALTRYGSTDKIGAAKYCSSGTCSFSGDPR